ncbi:MAG: hypothetical protein CL424_09065 [Acidimicrobiaceae bacterium]|nr:hypothetical protein [Acidimicrobiaceae bacterium]
MELPAPEPSKTWQTPGGDLSDDEWELIADLLDPPTRSKMGRPRKHTRRAIADAIFYVAATGCQWRNLPAKYPPWSTVHHYHVTWSRDGTCERVCDRLRNLVRLSEGREAEPSAGIIDARTVRGASTVTTTITAAGFVAHLAEPADTQAARRIPWSSRCGGGVGPKRRAKTDRSDAALLRELLQRGDLPHGNLIV